MQRVKKTVMINAAEFSKVMEEGCDLPNTVPCPTCMFPTSVGICGVCKETLTNDAFLVEVELARKEKECGSQSKRARTHSLDEVKQQLQNLIRWKKERPLDPGEQLDLSMLEGAACPNAPACQGVILATYKMRTPHCYLCCSHNDPNHLRNPPGTVQCKWNFNKITDADPNFATVLLRRREEELKNKENF